MNSKALTGLLVLSVFTQACSSSTPSRERRIFEEEVNKAITGGYCPEAKNSFLLVEPGSQGEYAPSANWIIYPTQDDAFTYSIVIQIYENDLTQRFVSDHELGHYCAVKEFYNPPILTKYGNLIGTNGYALVFENNGQYQSYSILEEGRATLMAVVMSDDTDFAWETAFQIRPYFYSARLVDLLGSKHNVDPFVTGFSELYQKVIGRSLDAPTIEKIVEIVESVSNQLMTPEEGAEAIEDLR